MICSHTPYLLMDEDMIGQTLLKMLPLVVELQLL